MNLHERALELKSYLEKAADVLTQGGVPDLAPFARNIEALCADIERAPLPEAMDVKPLLADLIRHLDEIAMNLNDLEMKKS